MENGKTSYLTIYPGYSLRGSLRLPGDKSISHRAALFAALAEGTSHIENFLVAGVTNTMLSALSKLSILWDLNHTTLQVQGNGVNAFATPSSPIECGNSATTLRLLSGALAFTGTPAVLTGSAGLKRRPMRRIVEPLQEMGVDITSSEGGTAPLTLKKRGKERLLHPLDYTLPVASAQVKTCLALAALNASSTSRLYEPGPSRDHTERMLTSMGANIKCSQLLLEGRHGAESSNHSLEASHKQYITQISPLDKKLAPLHLTIPGDISAAAFLIGAALITPGSHIRLVGVGLNPTRIGLLEALTEMGADIRTSNQGERHGEPYGDLTISYSKLYGITINGSLVVRMIDEFPALAIAAIYAKGETVIRDATELRHKESDRIASLCQELARLGVDITELPDGFSITGGKTPSGGVVDPHGDHRLAMALSVLGLASLNPVRVSGAEIIAESFPEFEAALQSLGAHIAIEYR